ncbi:MAG: anthranilate phosphoribosyltransferase [Methylocapsa sp.]|nr:anthranilate phosphoribosyltransferase [Methylocapsa sp.]
MEAFKPFIAKAASGSSLSEHETKCAFDLIFEGAVTPAQLGGFLLALRARGETAEEIAGAVSALRQKMIRIVAPGGAIDIVGTGGDGQDTYNISTLAALITAACGVPVAKHGNRAASSKSGASDVLGALGVGLDLVPRELEACLREAGICFMFACAHHPAIRHAAGVRAQLGTRTVFNLIGPLANPASAEYQLLGVFSRDWCEPLAHVLRKLGSNRAWVVHGSDGLDEATTTGPTFVTELFKDEIRSFEIVPEDAGIPRAPLRSLAGGGPAHNAAALDAVLGGAKGAYRDIAVLNAAIALIVAGKAEDLKHGALLAAGAIDDGRAADTLARLVKMSNRAAVPQAAGALHAAKVL